MENLISSVVSYFQNMTTRQIIAQLSGIVPVIVNMIMFQQKERTKLLQMKRLSDIVSSLSYLVFVWAGNPLAWASVFQCLIAAFRETVFLHKDQKWASGKIWLVLFIVLFYGSSFLTWAINKNNSTPVWLMFIPATASAIAIVSFWIGKPWLTRLLQFPIFGLMLSYELTVVAIANIFSDTLSTFSSVIGIFRIDLPQLRKKRREKESLPDKQ